MMLIGFHMMISLSEEDFLRLSPSCRAELLQVVTEKLSVTHEQEVRSAVVEVPVFAEHEFDWESAWTTSADAEDVSNSRRKRVVAISDVEAKALIANISGKSLQTLAMFVSGRPVAVNDLVGHERPYRDVTELKRSFIGAVTRRLRTVTKNRQAALFIKAGGTDDAQEAISIRPASANALRQALGIAEDKHKEGE